MHKSIFNQPTFAFINNLTNECIPKDSSFEAKSHLNITCFASNLFYLSPHKYTLSTSLQVARGPKSYPVETEDHARLERVRQLS